MKLLKTNINGGFPFYLDDIRYLSGGFETAIADFLKGIHETFVVSGVVATVTPGTPDTLTHTAGVVSFKGEICTVDALVTPLNISTYIYLTKVTTYDPAGNKTFESGAANDTYQINKVEFGSGASVPSGSVDITNVYSFGKSAGNLVFTRDTVTIDTDALTEIDSTAITAEYVSGDELKYIDSTVKALFVTFKTTDATPQITIIHNAGTIPTGTIAIKTPDGNDFAVNDGDTVAFFNDGTVFRMLAGGLNKSDVDTWHVVGDGGEPAFGGGWASGGLNLLQFTRTADKMVTINGAIAGATADLATTVFTLPAGYRPSVGLKFFYNDGTDIFTIVVETDGDVVVDSSTSPPATFNLFAHFSFPAA